MCFKNTGDLLLPHCFNGSNRLEATNWLITYVTRLGTGPELVNRPIPSLAISFSNWPLYTQYMSSTQLSKDPDVS
jgi:hypothetical protein